MAVIAKIFLILRPLPPGGWDRFFADPSLVLPADFEVGDDPPPQDRSALDWIGSDA